MKIVGGWLDVAQEIDYGAKSESRAQLKPSHIVLHGTAGGRTAQGIATYFALSQVQASAHLIIDAVGTIVQGISMDMAAWGNGILDHPRISLPAINPNLYSISIEHVKASTDNSDQLTDAQKQASFRVIECICDHYGIPKRRGDSFGGIIEHADLDSVSRARCPGPYPWNELLAFLKGAPPVATPNQWQIADAKKEWECTASLFGGSPLSYSTGIAQAWRARVYAGQRLGAPITAEYDSTDWSGNAIKVQQFVNARCEWRVDGSSCRFFDARGEIV
jgi:N-acetyl-anhydromuramyl-L-alanine amidase AmpD